MLKNILLLLCLPLAAGLQAQQLDYDTTFRSTYYEQKASLFRLLPDTEGEIIFLGNSITDIGEWAEIWQNPRVKNRGISADITFGVIARLDEVTASQPEKVFIMIGINDIARNIPDTLILNNHRRIVKAISAASPQTVIYLQSLLPVNGAFLQFKNHQGKDAHIAAVNKGLRAIAEEMGCTYVDLHTPFSDEQGQLDPAYTNDGLHLNGAGYLHWKAQLEALQYCCD